MLTEACARCRLFEACDGEPFFQPHWDNDSPDVVFVLEKPDRSEASGAPHPAGLNANHVDMAMKQLNIPYGYIPLTRCRPEGGKFPSGSKARSECANHMWADLAKAKPEIVVAMGKSAFKALTGMEKFAAHVGRVVLAKIPDTDRSVKVLVTHLPTAGIHNEKRFTEINEALEMIPPLLADDEKVEKHYVYCDTIEKVREAVETCRSAGRHSVDTETSGLNPYRSTGNPEFNEAVRGDFVACISLSHAPDYGFVIPVDHDESPWDEEEKTMVWAAVMGLLTDPEVEVGGSNVAFDLAQIEWNEARFTGRVQPRRTTNVTFDTQLAQHLLDENAPKGLKYLAAQHEGVYGYGDEVESLAAPTLDVWGYAKVPMKVLWWYAAMDADMSIRLADTLHEKLRADGLWDVYAKLEIGSIRACTDMRHAGWFINQTKLEENKVTFTAALEKATGDLYNFPSVKRFEYDRVVELVKEKANLVHLVCNMVALEPDLFRETWAMMPECIEWIIKEAEKKRKDRDVEQLRNYEVFHNVVWWVIEQDRENVKDWMPKSYNWDFNPNSPDQLAAILFVYQQCPIIKRSKKSGKPSTDVNVLKELARREPFAQVVQEYRRAQKVHSVNVVTVPGLVDHNYVLHTDLKIDGTTTGRLSSASPNLQNIPWDKDIKSMFHTRFGPWWPGNHPWYRETPGSCIQIDYSQLELRIAAAFSGDEGMIAAFIRGDDMHTWTAALIFGKDPGDITKEERRFAKTVAFGLIYGRSVQAIAEATGYTEEHTAELVDTWFARVPGLKEWIGQIQKKARKDLHVRTAFGRRRWVKEIKSRDAQQQAHAKRVAVNSPIQGTAADICKDVMVDVDNWLWDNKFATLMILQIHDSLIFDCPPEEVDYMVETLPRMMERAYDWLNGVPLVVDVETGITWGDFRDEEETEEIVDDAAA